MSFIISLLEMQCQIKETGCVTMPFKVTRNRDIVNNLFRTRRLIENNSENFLKTNWWRVQKNHFFIMNVYSIVIL